MAFRVATPSQKANDKSTGAERKAARERGREGEGEGGGMSVSYVHNDNRMLTRLK